MLHHQKWQSRPTPNPFQTDPLLYGTYYRSSCFRLTRYSLWGHRREWDRREFHTNNDNNNKSSLTGFARRCPPMCIFSSKNISDKCFRKNPDQRRIQSKLTRRSTERGIGLPDSKWVCCQCLKGHGVHIVLCQKQIRLMLHYKKW